MVATPRILAARKNGGATPAPVNAELQSRVLEGGEAISCRPADLLDAELDALTEELNALATEKSITLEQGEREIDDVLTYALFPQVGLKFLEHRGDPSAFEPAPGTEPETAAPPPAPASDDAGVYTVKVNGQQFVVEVSEGGEIGQITPSAMAAPAPVAAQAPQAQAGGGEPVTAPLAGNIVRVEVTAGDSVAAGDVLVILEAMKMETEVRASRAASVASIGVKAGDVVAVGDTLLTLA